MRRSGAGQQSWVFLPLATADGTVGACVIGYDRPRAFPSEDQVTYAGVAGILAQSLERAMLFDKGRRQMTELQRLMLPMHLFSAPASADPMRAGASPCSFYEVYKKTESPPSLTPMHYSIGPERIALPSGRQR